MVFEKELKKLGLKDKEAAVYVACLQLGPSPVQQIARKAKVVRATTYVVLEALENQGLVTHYKEEKRTLYSAEPPRQLTRLLEKEREVIDEKQHDLELMLPELQILMKAAGDRPSVRYFSGIDGLRAIRREMVMYSEAGDVWYSFTPTDHLEAVFGKGGELTYTEQRVAKGIRAKTLFATKSMSLKEDLLSVRDNLVERRFLPARYYRSASGMTIYRDRVAIGVFVGKVGGVIIESQLIADMMRSLFEMAWQSAEIIDNK